MSLEVTGHFSREKMDKDSNEITLGWQSVFATARVPYDTVLASRINFETARSPTADELLIRLWTYCLTEELETQTHRFYAKYPANWWEAFKERWLPWLAIKYIEKEESVFFAARAWYPELKKAQFKNTEGAIIKITKEVIDLQEPY